MDFEWLQYDWKGFEVILKRLEVNLKSFGNHVGLDWETFGNRLEMNWESIGNHLGIDWKSFGACCRTSGGDVGWARREYKQSGRV